MPTAAAVAILLVLGGRGDRMHDTVRTADHPPAEAAPAGMVDGLLKPVGAENVLYAALDEGFITLEDGTTVRRHRLQYVAGSAHQRFAHVERAARGGARRACPFLLNKQSNQVFP